MVIPTEAEAGLVRDLATRTWLRGDTLLATAGCCEIENERFRVRGLDARGIERSVGGRMVEGFMDAFMDDNTPVRSVAVHGEHPRCLAVGCYRAVSEKNAWLVVTSHRVAVLRLRDLQGDSGDVMKEFSDSVRNPESVRGVQGLRKLGKFLKDVAVESVREVRRPPLTERPQDAALVSEFEISRADLVRIERWKPTLIPNFSMGPRHLQLHFRDGSWARVQTDVAGAIAMAGPETS
ncbi:hypothetical protein LX15_001454 [Streptoalloteichus tenebrarius]|uniref:Uncharacterized protein n=1 Tax=Streptoalloteichus tenebrarius (strain ATCC 17920 / DSM 40477 / JCM 4838 / CBS 697.72 / NBRC 16177 / NCIMB 11028 / NRRL B-12390 / A12253. 1 / ISP 5477) TaxID=1933 RepID=A0ABT1HQI6_STRSD|nr:hypothetical protein [Streptoalloteichus tenebrarius]MCP2257768.1 hypothetical protein [Streptoalloteichus tenebrarius]BFE99872.1 hypothetical protein GCM10020241_15480 [Streptoalloteichus tenebrarius]